MANKNNPNSSKLEARVVKHPGKRDRCVVCSPKKEELKLTVKVVEPKAVIRFGMDGIFRIWDKGGHLVKWGETETVSVEQWQEYIDGLMGGL